MPRHEDVYSEDGRYDNPSILKAWEDEDYFCIIISLGCHPCAYIGVRATHPYFGLDYDEIHEKYDIYVHGGFTYTDTQVIGMSLDRWWIGWDYSHYNDYGSYGKELNMNLNGHKWTLTEIEIEVNEVLKQLREAGSK